MSKISSAVSRNTRKLLALACSLVAVTGAAHAKCGGKSILPELSSAHPEIMQSVRAAADKIINTQAILWRVEKPGLTPSHLFGTMHVSDQRITTMPKLASKALHASKIVALELADVSPTAMMKAVAKVPQLMVYTDGSRLEKKLKPEEFETISQLLASSGLPKEMASVIRPWMVSIMLAVPQCETQRTASGYASLDLHISNMAKNHKIPVVGLETIATQLKSLAAVPDADQIAMLRVSIAFLKQRDDLFETLIQSYLKRDIGIVLALSNGMAKMAGLENSGFASFSRELIKKRNHTMFETSLPLVDQGNAFVAVGAAHLIGDTGLVALYRKAGFTVTAVN